MNFRLTLYKTLSIIAIVFWSVIFIHFTFFQFPGLTNYPVIKPLLLLEPILFLVALLGIAYKINIIYYSALFFTFANALLSIADEVGTYDILSLVFNLLMFGNLISLWPMFKKQKLYATRSKTR